MTLFKSHKNAFCRPQIPPKRWITHIIQVVKQDSWVKYCKLTEKRNNYFLTPHFLDTINYTHLCGKSMVIIFYCNFGGHFDFFLTLCEKQINHKIKPLEATTLDHSSEQPVRLVGLRISAYSFDGLLHTTNFRYNIPAVVSASHQSTSSPRS